MRILITGGAGFIGSHLIEAALRDGHHVETIDRITYAGCLTNLPWRFRGFRCVDVCDRTMVDATLARVRPDWVIHAAAETHVGRAVSGESEVFLQTNVIGTHVMLEACLAYWREREHDPAFRFLHVSTDEVHGSIEVGEWTEGSQYAPNNQYAASKAAADHLCRAYWATQQLPVIVTHCGNNYGTRQHPEKLIPTLIRQALAGEPFTLHGDGLHVRDWIAVEDHCAGLLAACARGEPGAVYAFSAGETLTNSSVAGIVAGTVGCVPQLTHIADRAGNDRRYAMDCRATRAALGWAPPTELKDQMLDMIEWYRANPNPPYGQGATREWG
jgi:dTDP-glucose 4,6-dehydratase